MRRGGAFWCFYYFISYFNFVLRANFDFFTVFLYHFPMKGESQQVILDVVSRFPLVSIKSLAVRLGSSYSSAYLTSKRAEKNNLVKIDKLGEKTIIRRPGYRLQKTSLHDLIASDFLLLFDNFSFTKGDIEGHEYEHEEPWWEEEPEPEFDLEPEPEWFSEVLSEKELRDFLTDHNGHLVASIPDGFITVKSPEGYILPFFVWIERTVPNREKFRRRFVKWAPFNHIFLVKNSAWDLYVERRNELGLVGIVLSYEETTPLSLRNSFLKSVFSREKIYSSKLESLLNEYNEKKYLLQQNKYFFGLRYEGYKLLDKLLRTEGFTRLVKFRYIEVKFEGKEPYGEEKEILVNKIPLCVKCGIKAEYKFEGKWYCRGCLKEAYKNSSVRWL